MNHFFFNMEKIMTAGRPKEYDRIQIGKEFVKWATNNPDALTVPMFAVSIGLHSGIMRNWARETEEFRALFTEGKEQIGINRLRSTQAETLDNSIYRAHVGNYDVDINEYMREEKEFESKIKTQENALATEEDNRRHQETLDQLKELRSERNKDNNNNNPAT